MAIITNKTSLFSSTKKYTIVNEENTGSLIITQRAPDTAPPETIGPGVYWVTYGTVNGVVIEGTESGFSVVGAGSKHIYVKCTIDKFSSNDDIRVRNASIEISNSAYLANLSYNNKDFPISPYYYLGYISSLGAISNTGSGSLTLDIRKTWTAVSNKIERSYAYNFYR